MNTRLALRLTALLVCSLPAGKSQAAGQLVTHLSLFYFTDHRERSVEAGDNDYLVKQKDHYTFMSLGLCYQVNPLCLGVKYTQYDKESSLNRTGNRGSSKNLTRMKGPGLSIGYADDSIFAQGVYYLGATKEINDSDMTVYGGTGSGDLVYPVAKAYSLELGYGFKAGSVRVGPLLSITSFTYEKVSFAGSSIKLPADEKDEFIVPQVAIWVDL